MSNFNDNLDTHLTNLGARLSQQRYSAGRNSVASTSSHQSLQNVTDSLDMQRLSSEISETENSIRELEKEIARRSNMRSARTAAQVTEYYDVDGEDGGDDKFDEFPLRHSRPRTYRPYFTLTFLILCFLMFLVEIGANGGRIEDVQFNPLIGPSVDTLIKLGAKETDKIQHGDVYRLFAPMILHVGIVHLVANMLGLISIGIPMEQEFGTWRVATIALSSGFFGIILSSLFAPNMISVGASGAIFGLFGAAWADLIQNWRTYQGKNVVMLVQLIIVTAINFIFGLMPFLDNFAHIGGFICGLATGMALLVKKYGDMKPSHALQVLLRAVSAILLPILVIGMLFLLFFGFDLADNCGFCSYLSCVPFPPRVDREDRWWDCTPCTNGYGDFFNFTQGFGVDVVCPNGTKVFAALNDPTLTEKEFDRDFIAYCSVICEN